MIQKRKHWLESQYIESSKELERVKMLSGAQEKEIYELKRSSNDASLHTAHYEARTMVIKFDNSNYKRRMNKLRKI